MPIEPALKSGLINNTGETVIFATIHTDSEETNLPVIYYELGPLSLTLQIPYMTPQQYNNVRYITLSRGLLIAGTTYTVKTSPFYPYKKEYDRQIATITCSVFGQFNVAVPGTIPAYNLIKSFFPFTTKFGLDHPTVITKVADWLVTANMFQPEHVFRTNNLPDINSTLKQKRFAELRHGDENTLVLFSSSWPTSYQVIHGTPPALNETINEKIFSRLTLFNPNAIPYYAKWEDELLVTHTSGDTNGKVHKLGYLNSADTPVLPIALPLYWKGIISPPALYIQNGDYIRLEHEWGNIDNVVEITEVFDRSKSPPWYTKIEGVYSGPKTNPSVAFNEIATTNYRNNLPDDTLTVDDLAESVDKLSTSLITARAWTISQAESPGNSVYLSDVCWSEELQIFAASLASNLNANQTPIVVANKVYLSADGLNWTGYVVASSSLNIIYNIQWINHLHMFIAIGANVEGTPGSPKIRIYTSPNGINWTTRVSEASQTGEGRGIATNGTTVICSTSGINAVYRTTDGINFTKMNITGGSVSWSEHLSQFLIMSSQARISSDGITWSSYNFTNRPSNTKHIYSERLKRYVTATHHSSNGIDWTTSYLLRGTPLPNAIAESPAMNILITVAPDGTNDQQKIYSSVDGISWNAVLSPGTRWNGICWSPSLKMFCVVGSNTHVIINKPTIQAIDQYRDALAIDIPLNTSQFDDILSPADNNLQAAMDTIDDHNHPAATIAFTPTAEISATNVQAAIQELDTEKQPANANLSTIAGLTPADNDIIQRKSGAWTNRTMAQLRVDLDPTAGSRKPFRVDGVNTLGFDVTANPYVPPSPFTAVRPAANHTFNTSGGLLNMRNWDSTSPLYLRWTSATSLTQILATVSLSPTAYAIDTHLFEIRGWAVQNPGASDRYWSVKWSWLGASRPQYPLCVSQYSGTGITLTLTDGTASGLLVPSPIGMPLLPHLRISGGNAFTDIWQAGGSPFYSTSAFGGGGLPTSFREVWFLMAAGAYYHQVFIDDVHLVT